MKLLPPSSALSILIYQIFYNHPLKDFENVLPASTYGQILFNLHHADYYGHLDAKTWAFGHLITEHIATDKITQRLYLSLEPVSKNIPKLSFQQARKGFRPLSAM